MAQKQPVAEVNVRGEMEQDRFGQFQKNINSMALLSRRLWHNMASLSSVCGLLCAVALLGVCKPAQAAPNAPVRIVTSLSESVVRTYQQVYQQRFPDEQLEFERKSTSELIRMLTQDTDAQRPDVVWMSSIDAFELLARGRQLQSAGIAVNPQLPERIGKVRLNAESGLYYGQSLAGYGIMFNTEYLRAKQLPVPQQWADLTKPEYQGHVSISTPARSGTMHVMAESILQGEGWDKGWAQLLQIAGNAGEITTDSGKVPQSVQGGQFGLGMVIDAFGLSAKYSGMPVGFVYPDMSPMVPVSIGLVAHAANPEGAKRFMAFTLSRDGQQLLLDSRINRLPVMPQTLLQVPGGYPDPYEFARRARLQYDAKLSSERYPLVSQLFEQMATLCFKELRNTTAALQAAEQALASQGSARAKALVAKARTHAYTPVVTAQMLRDEQWMKTLHANGGKPTAQMLQAWQIKARSNYIQAAEMVRQAMEMGKSTAR